MATVGFEKGLGTHACGGLATGLKQLNRAGLYYSHESVLVNLISFIPMIFQAFSNAPLQKYKSKSS
jgi:hypothetical protein